jgi:hypothetical protein
LDLIYIKQWCEFKIIAPVLFVLFGIMILISPEMYLSRKQLSVVFIICSLSWLINNIKQKYYIQISNKTYNFKSKKEAFIAGFFKIKKIKYIYEKPLKIGSQKLKPDFYLPEYDVYVEYWGLFNSNFEYKKACNHKRKLYEEEGIKLVELYPDNLATYDTLNRKFMERLLNVLKK